MCLSIASCGGVVIYCAEAIAHLSGVHACLVEIGGYTVHGVGIIPLVKYVEPIILAIAGSAE